MRAKVTLWVDVENPQVLLEAAREHPDCRDLVTENFYGDDGEPDVKFCLAMLLDPGYLPGVSIEEHEVEIIE